MGVGWVWGGRRVVESKRRGAGSVGRGGVRSASMVVSGVTWGHFRLCLVVVGPF